MKLDGVSEQVFLDRYALKGEKGELLEYKPEEMWRRVARGIAQNEKKAKQAFWEEKFYKVMEDFKFVPGGRILSGAGTGYQVTYFNCFVIPSPKDSREGILEALKQLVEIQSRSGGVGLNLSSLRPRGARVKKVNGTSSGPVTWAGLFSYATHDVVQQGGTRRGATMLMLWDWHPDVEEFITVKQDLSKINGANLSVCISDAFMEAVKNDADWDLVYPDLDDPKYDKYWNGEIDLWKKRGGKVKVYKTVKARYLWDLICTAAWRSAEPGLHFLERSNKRSNTWYFERLVATNPCGEQPLGPWAVCNLGAMNLAAYVEGEGFDYKRLGDNVKTAIRLLDNVIDQTYYFYPQNEKCAKEIRRTGLGVMGIADCLIKMKLRYGSEESLPVVQKMFETLRDSAYEASADLAREKGAFPKFDKVKYLEGYHIKALPKRLQEKIAREGIRNAVLLTIAPTGTTSLLAGVSSGVEPVYEFEFIRRDRMGEHMMYHPLFEAWKKDHPSTSSGQVPEKPAYFVSANDLTPLEHAKVQAVAQEYIDSSISKTVNAPNAHTVEDVKTLYMAAYDLGLKGVTYMRDGSRAGVLSRVEEKPATTENTEKSTENTESVKSAVVTNGHASQQLTNGHSVLPRPTRLEGATYKMVTPIGHTFVTINNDDKGNPFEVFITIGKSGSDVSAMAEALGRLISLNLRITNGGIPAREKVKRVVDQLSGIGGSRAVGFGENRVRSLPDAVAKILTMHYGLKAPVTNGTVEKVTNGNGKVKEVDDVKLVDEKKEVEEKALQPLPFQEASRHAGLSSMDICPECGSAALALEEGCRKCYSCGYAEC